MRGGRHTWLEPRTSQKRGLSQAALGDAGQERGRVRRPAACSSCGPTPHPEPPVSVSAAAHQVLTDGRCPPSLPEPCWAHGDRPQQHKQAVFLAPGTGSRTSNSNPRTHSPSQDPHEVRQVQGSSSISPPQGGPHHRPHSQTTTSLQKPSAHQRANGNLFIFLSFKSFPKWLFLAKCLT